MTYKALRRKADKQWMTFGEDNLLITSSFPVKVIRELDYYVMYYPYDDWNLYELVTVHVIADDELLSDDEMRTKQFELYKTCESIGEVFIEFQKWYKSQLLKP